MHIQQRNLLLLTVMAAAMATPAWGQAAPPPEAGAASKPSASAAPVPDLSGMWAHVTCCGFEPARSGPGPVTNRSRDRSGAGNLYRFIGDYTNPILKPEAAQLVKKFGEIEASGVPAPSPSRQCWPGGVPFVIWNIGMELIQQPHQVIIVYSNDHEVRHVRMNAPHHAPVTPSWYGDSVGHYEGDALVVDTVGVKVGPYAMVDWYGTPHTAALHVVERYRLLDYADMIEAEERGTKETFRLEASDAGFARDPNDKGKGLQLQFTVEDQGVFTTPWTATMTYRRPLSPLGQWPEMVCAENPSGYFDGEKAAIPTAGKPDF
jgi:hypothetical protein